jgi:hypothetical protein
MAKKSSELTNVDDLGQRTDTIGTDLESYRDNTLAVDTDADAMEMSDLRLGL